MDLFSTGLSFLDLSGIDDAERQNVLQFLSVEDPCVKLPWARTRSPRSPPQTKQAGGALAQPKKNKRTSSTKTVITAAVNDPTPHHRIEQNQTKTTVINSVCPTTLLPTETTITTTITTITNQQAEYYSQVQLPTQPLPLPTTAIIPTENSIDTGIMMNAGNPQRSMVRQHSRPNHQPYKQNYVPIRVQPNNDDNNYQQQQQNYAPYPPMTTTYYQVPYGYAVHPHDPHYMPQQMVYPPTMPVSMPVPSYEQPRHHQSAESYPAMEVPQNAAALPPPPPVAAPLSAYGPPTAAPFNHNENYYHHHQQQQQLPQQQIFPSNGVRFEATAQAVAPSAVVAVSVHSNHAGSGGNVNNVINNDADNVNGNERSSGAPPGTTPTYSQRTRHQTNLPPAIAAAPATNNTIVEQQQQQQQQQPKVVANTKKTKQRRTSPKSSHIVVATPPQQQQQQQQHDNNELNLLPATAANGKQIITPEKSPDNVTPVEKDNIDVTTIPQTSDSANNNNNIENNNDNENSNENNKENNNGSTSVTSPPTPVAVPETKCWASLFKPASSLQSSASTMNGDSSRSKNNNNNDVNNIKLREIPDQLALNGKNINNGNAAAMNGKTSSSSGGDEKNYNYDSNHQVMTMKGHPAKKRTEQQPVIIDPISYRLGEYLLNYTVDGRTISLQPRGLINRSNYCYINSILQALLACPPVYNLLSGLTKVNVVKDKARSTPIIDGLCRFVKEFKHLSANQRVNRRNLKNQRRSGENSQPQTSSTNIDCDPPFEPFWMYKVLNGTRSDSFLVEGRQEDAEEFLGCLLNGLNDEISGLMDLSRDNDRNRGGTSNNYNSDISNGNNNDWNSDLHGMDEDPEEDGWQVMGPKNKGAITRQTDISRTPISDIFGGLLKSEIHRADDRSTFNIQPFFTLQLNIEKVRTVQEALEALVTKNQLEGLTSSKTNEEVNAWQQVKVEELPVILVLHLKCFDFKLNGCTKIIKALEFPIDLKIDQRLLSSKPKERQYKLFAVVYHEGKEANKGHFITDTFNVGYSSWLRHDDGSIKPISEDEMLHPQGTQVPYLLFYKRADIISSRINNTNSNNNNNSNNVNSGGKT